MKSTIERIDTVELLRILGDQAPVGICIIQDGKFRYFNSNFPIATGYTADELVGKDSLEIVAPEDRDMVRENTIKMLKGELLSPYQFRVTHKDGGVVWIMGTVKSIQYRGRPATLGNYMEVTERKQAEERIRESETRYRLLAENTVDIIWTVDIARPTRLTYISPSVTRLLGYSVEESMTKEMQEVFAPASFDTAMKAFAEEMASEQKEHSNRRRSKRLELQLRHKNGSLVDVEVNFSLIRGVDGQKGEILAVARDVTERKRMEEAAKESQERYKELASSITDVFFAMDEHLRYTYWNKASEALTGIRAEDAIGKSLEEIFPGRPWRRRAERMYRKVLKTQQLQTFVNDYDINGRRYILEINAYPARGGVSVFVRDISERKRAEEAQREAEEEARALLEEAPVSIVHTDLEGDIIYVNKRFEAESDYSRREVIGKNAFQLDWFPPDTLSFLTERMAARLAGSPAKHWETQFKCKDGRWIWIELEGKILRRHGVPVGFEIIATNITERKQAEAALRQSEERYRTILEEMGDGYFETDLAGNLTFVNDALISLLGYSRGEMTGMNFRTLRPEEEAKGVFKAYNRMYKTGEPLRNFHTEIIRKDGRHLFAETSAFPIRNDKGEIIGFRGVRHDITERKQAEEALRESEEKHRKMFEEALDAIFIADAETGLVLDCNRAACELVGRKRSELIGKHQRILHPAGETEGEFSRTFSEHLRAGEGKVIETQIITAKGEIKEAAIKANAFEIRGKKVIQGIFRDITQRKQAEQALRQSEKKYRTILEEMEEGYYEVDLAGNFTFVNDAMSRILGYSPDELIGMNYKTYTEKENVKAVFEAYNRVYRTCQRLQWFPMVEVRKDGTRVLVEDSVLPITNGKAEVVGFRGISRDVTERKRAEEALRQSEERYRTMLEEMEDAYSEVDLGGHLAFVNNSVCRDLGYSREELLGMSYKKFTAEDNIAPLFQVFNEVYRTGVPNKGFPWKTIRKDGTHGFAESSVSPIRNERSEVIGFRTVGRDVTERKKAEEELSKTQAKLSSAVQMAHLGPWEYDVVNDLFIFNDAFYELFHTTAEEVGGYTMSSAEYARRFVHPDDAHLVGEEVRRALKTDNPNFSSQVDHRIIYTDGEVGHISVRFSIVKDEAGSTVRTYGVNQDITERKRAEEKLRQSEENYRALFDNSVIGTIVFDAETRQAVMANQAAAKIFEFSSPQDGIGRNPLDFVPSEDKERVFQAFTKDLFEQDLRRTAQFRAVTKSGREIWLSVTAARIMHEGRLAGLVCFTDITEQKRQNERLMMTDRLASIGELASGTAHELNNPLTSIIGFSQLLMEREVPDDVREDLKLINSEAQRAADVTRNLLTFARKHTPVKQLSQINNILEDVLRLRAYEHKINNITVVKQLAPSLPEMMIDYFQMQQVFMNIIINAEYFMTAAHKRGTLAITTKKQNGAVRISIADDGPGIPPEDLKRIFDPFFTTKETGKGTGLGLSICHGIVTEHGGQIYARSQLGKGATVHVELPINGVQTISKEAVKQGNPDQKRVSIVKEKE
jgi:PAS domain S-box-containing protein